MSWRLGLLVVSVTRLERVFGGPTRLFHTGERGVINTLQLAYGEMGGLIGETRLVQTAAVCNIMVLCIARVFHFTRFRRNWLFPECANWSIVVAAIGITTAFANPRDIE